MTMRSTRTPGTEPGGRRRPVRLWSRATGALLAIGLIAVPVHGEDAPPSGAAPKTLAQAFARALAVNPQLGQAREEIAAAEADRRLKLSYVLPRLTLSGSLVRNSTDVSFGEGADARTILPEDDWNTRLTLQQPIYAGARETKAYEQSKLGIVNAKSGLAGAEEQTLVGVAAAWFQLRQATALVDVEAGGVELARHRKELAQALLDAGETTKVEVLRAVVAEKAAERRLASARQAREEAVGRLRVMLALPPSVDIEADEKGLEVPVLPGEEQLFAAAAAERSLIRQAETNVEIATLEVGKQKGAYLPVIGIEAFWTKQKSTFPSDNYGSAALRLSWPIFQSGEVAAKVAMADARLRQEKLALDDARRTVREQVRQALFELDTATRSLALAEEQLAAAEAEYAQVAELYRVRETTAIEAESAENFLLDARRASVTARLEHKLAELRGWAVAGSLQRAVLGEARTNSEPTPTPETSR